MGDSPEKNRHLAVLATTAADQACADQLAGRLDLRLLAPGIDPVTYAEAEYLLVVNGGSLSLQKTGKGVPGPVSVDFASASLRHRRRSGTGELLGRAVGSSGKRSLTILDVTAGLARDAFILAGLGHQVRLCERNPVLAEMLRSGLEDAIHRGDDSLRDITLRMSLYPVDARQLDALIVEGVNVIYLDPMFPGRDKSAAVKKEMVLLQQLLGESEDTEALFGWALEQPVDRLVVKRPVRASSLGGLQPSHSIKGKSVRYDVYLRRIAN